MTHGDTVTLLVSGSTEAGKSLSRSPPQWQLYQTIPDPEVYLVPGGTEVIVGTTIRKQDSERLGRRGTGVTQPQPGALVDPRPQLQGHTEPQLPSRAEPSRYPAKYWYAYQPGFGRLRPEGKNGRRLRHSPLAICS